MPYAEQKTIADALNLTATEGLKNAVNRPTEQIPVPMFICPSDPALGSPIMTRFATHNASPAYALWYPASMGPTRLDQCPFCQDDRRPPRTTAARGGISGRAPAVGSRPGR